MTLSVLIPMPSSRGSARSPRLAGDVGAGSSISMVSAGR